MPGAAVKPGAAPGGGSQRWKRTVSVDQYRRLTTVSSLLGIVVLAWGLLWLFTGRVTLGLVLIVAGFVIGLWTGLLRIEGAPAPLQSEALGEEHWSPRVLHFYTRRECMLCEEAKARLGPVLAERQISLVEHDVDRDAVLRERFGSRVPVAVYEGSEVFSLEFDEAAVRSLR